MAWQWGSDSSTQQANPADNRGIEIDSTKVEANLRSPRAELPSKLFNACFHPCRIPVRMLREFEHDCLRLSITLRWWLGLGLMQRIVWRLTSKYHHHLPPSFWHNLSPENLPIPTHFCSASSRTLPNFLNHTDYQLVLQIRNVRHHTKLHSWQCLWSVVNSQNCWARRLP